MPPYAILALVSAFGYSFGSLFNKQAMAGGSGLFRITAFSIWTSALLALPFACFHRAPFPLHLWFQPLTAGMLFFTGQLLFILALRVGDLSIVAPVSGAKPVLNALLVAALLGVRVPAVTWIACFLTAIALIVLRSPNASTSHSFLRTAAVSLLSALSFALCDTCFQEWARGWGVLRFAALVFTVSSLGACALIPFFAEPWRRMTPVSKAHSLSGAAFCALPGLCMGVALGRYGHAPEVNVIYGTRAVISILAVRHLGRFVGSSEQHVSRNVLLRRLIGAAILMAAVGMVLSTAG